MSRRSQRRARRQRITHEATPAVEPGRGSDLFKGSARFWWSFAAIIAVALLASIAGFANSFTQDDVAIIVASTRLHDLGDVKSILTLPYWSPPAAPDLYRPLTSLFLATQYVIGPGSPAIFRAVSYVLYALSAIGVFRLASRELPWSIAFAAAAVFAAHPIHVEAVVLAVAQNEIFVALLATVVVVRYVDRRRDGTLTTGDWVFLSVCYVLAAFSKEQGLLLPLFPILAELCLLKRVSLRDRARDLWKGYAVLGAIGAVALLARTAVLQGHVAPTMIAEALRGQTMAGRALTMLHVIPEWVRLLAFPYHLRAEYSPQEFVASRGVGPYEMAGLAIVLIAIGVVWVARRRAPMVSFGILWVVVAILPVSNVLIPTGILIAERTLFLASAGFVLAAAGVAGYVAERWSLPRWGHHAAAAATALLVVAGVARSALRQRVWRDETTLTAASIKDAPRSWRVRQSHAEMLFDQHRANEGIVAFEGAIALAPEPWRARNRLAQRLRMIGADSAALDHLRRSIAENPREMETVAQVPPTLIALGRYEEARKLADTIIGAVGPLPVMVWLRHVADSALAAKAPAGSIRVGLGER